jgi:hypothetical protein
MAEQVPFQLRLTGDTADYHQFQGYDGYMALAGFAWTLSLATNFAETGKIRHRGNFPGRRAVRAYPIDDGSIIAEFSVWLQNTPQEVFGTVAAVSGAHLLYGIVQRVVSRNVGRETNTDAAIDQVTRKKAGDFEALVAVSEPSIRQTHDVIGNGADQISIAGGINILETLDRGTLDYVRMNVEDATPKEGVFTVSAFDANSGYGRVFDPVIGRGVPVTMVRENLRRYGSIFSWGLDQYTNRTGGRVHMNYTRILAADGRPKRYVVTAAERAR